MITWNYKHQFELSNILQWQPYIIGGSFITNKETANDVDVCIHEFIHYKSDVQQGLYKAGFQPLRKGDKKYDEIDRTRLMEVYAGNIEECPVNIIVVGACFWPAYIGAVTEMSRNPELYQTREARVNLHRTLSRDVAKIARIELPESAY